jgi:riboflavin synthase
MFTGIVLGQGTVRKVRGHGVVTLEFDAPQIARELKIGDSVAVNGVCLTATSSGRKKFEVQAMPETLARSTIGGLKRGSKVNLEPAMRFNDRLGGHLVQGHVDGTATVIRIEDDADARRVWFSADDELLRYMVPKGSITLDGVSLTLVEVGRTSFQVALIPLTLQVTTFESLRVGSTVNVEADVLAKYVERLLKKE